MTEVERWWMRMHADGQDLAFPHDPDGIGLDFTEAGAPGAQDDLGSYLAELDEARAALEGKSLDLVVPSRGDHPEQTRDVRWIFVHMIEEYARHNGHADLLREAIDGQTGD